MTLKEALIEMSKRPRCESCGTEEELDYWQDEKGYKHYRCESCNEDLAQGALEQ